MQKCDFVIIGGDTRMSYAAKELLQKGFDVGCFANYEAAALKNITGFSSLKEAVLSCENIVFGIPFSKNGAIYTPLCTNTVTAGDVADCILPGQHIMAGMPGDFSLMCAKKGAICSDYGIREDFCTLNAIPTAEAIISILSEKLPVTLWGSNILIAGYGRIGKILSQRLVAFGADVTVCARKKADFALASACGIKCINTANIADFANRYDIIINTIPAPIFSEKIFAALKQGCIIADVSAYPGFVSEKEAAKFDIEVIGAFSLPGKKSPGTAGKIIADVVLNIIDELKGV